MSRNRHASHENDDHSRYLGSGYRGPEENFGMGEIDPHREGTLERIRSQQLNQTSDSRMQQEAYDALTKHSQVDLREIEIEVIDRVVYLRGSVFDRDTKRQAEESLNGINGVVDVMNEIRVIRSELKFGQ